MPAKWMLKDSSETPSGSFTFATISFIVVTICVLLSGFQTMTLGAMHITFKPVDATLALGYLAATFSAYVVRRTTSETTKT